MCVATDENALTKNTNVWRDYAALSVRQSSQSICLHCALAAAQRIVIGPVCLFVGGWICYHDNS